MPLQTVRALPFLARRAMATETEKTIAVHTNTENETITFKDSADTSHISVQKQSQDDEEGWQTVGTRTTENSKKEEEEGFIAEKFSDLVLWGIRYFRTPLHQRRSIKWPLNMDDCIYVYIHGHRRQDAETTMTTTTVADSDSFTVVDEQSPEAIEWGIRYFATPREQRNSITWPRNIYTCIQLAFTKKT